MNDRAIGYCTNSECNEFSKSIFLMDGATYFYCPNCRQCGQKVVEHGSYTGEGDIFREVKVEFDYTPIEGKYRSIASVTDTSLLRGDCYTLKSPLIRTEKRALKVAESILANLNRGSGIAEGTAHTNEILLSFDDSREDFALKCEKLARDLADSNLAIH